MQRRLYPGVFLLRHAVLQSRQQPVVELHQTLVQNQGQPHLRPKVLRGLRRPFQGAAIEFINLVVLAHIAAHGFRLPVPALRQCKISPPLAHVQKIRFALPVPNYQKPHRNHHADRCTVCTNRDERVQTNGRLSCKIVLGRKHTTTHGKVSRRLLSEFKPV